MIDKQNQERLKELQRKWLNKTISSEELVELEEWYDRDQNEPVYVPSDFAADENEIERRMLEKIKDRRHPVKAKVIRGGYFRWVAAAAIISIIGLGGYIWLSSKTSMGPSDNKVVVNNDILPGVDKAVLQLADGTSIPLDNAVNGTIKKQGNADVVKSGGELIYNAKTVKTGLPEVYNTMLTPRGGQYKLTLADGTMVWLNSASSLCFPTSFTGKERIVELTGEAYFEVAHNASKPFRVKVDAINVEVLGTHFNINAYSNEPEIQTTLLEGSVLVNTVSGEKVKLLPRQQAKVSHLSTNRLILLKNVNIDHVLSWQKGVFQFRNADINLIARQLSRWYDIDVATRGSMNEIELGGGISKKVPLSHILEALKISGVDYKWESGKLILYSP